jgi:hypothetical protein
VDDATVRVVRKIVGTLEGRAAFDIRWRGAALDRLLDERHAALGSKVVEALVASGWEPQVEVSYSSYGERGAIDVLGWHAETRSLLVVELKTDVASVEELLRKHDEKVRLGPRIALERWNWRTVVVARVLVLPEDGTSRRRWATAQKLLSTAMPSSTVDVKRWIREPRGPLAGVWFLPLSGRSSASKSFGSGERVRRPKSPRHTGRNGERPRHASSI